MKKNKRGLIIELLAVTIFSFIFHAVGMQAWIPWAAYFGVVVLMFVWMLWIAWKRKAIRKKYKHWFKDEI
jgi:O-antigen/teichoic acid export membrane protein